VEVTTGNVFLDQTDVELPARVGTVRGIGEALQYAHQAVSGNIQGVTESLGITFNATFVALTSSIIVMFFLHQLQLAQERMVLDTETYLDQHLLRHMRSG